MDVEGAGLSPPRRRRDEEDEDSDAEADALAYAASAREISEKVRKQQEGLETNLLTSEHRDDDFQMTMDEVSLLIRSQLDASLSKIDKSPHGGAYGGGVSAFSRFFSASPSPEANAQDALGSWFVERSKFVPMRLNLAERKRLRLIDAALRTSTYVNRVDEIYASTLASGGNTAAAKQTRTKRVQAIQMCISTTMIGLVTALDFEAGADLARNKNYADHQDAIREMFELARRYKIMNPDRLRDSYGVLIMMLQDMMSPEGREMLQFDVVAPIKTVYDTLEQGDALNVLRHEMATLAAMEITNENGKRDRNELRQLVKAKEKALDYLGRKFENPSQDLSRDDVQQCLYSMGDNSSYNNSNCKPIDEMIHYLKRFFDPRVVGESPSKEDSLAIFGGVDGARLTHSHTRQYDYVLQTLTLWREIIHEIFRLWTLAERDLLDGESPYKFRDTGQGHHRMQPSPRVSKAMHGILYSVQQTLARGDSAASAAASGWVGSSVIHLNDSNVPNALVFIDKWNQVPRILNAIIHALRNLDSFVAKNPPLVGLIADKFGSIEGAKKRILHSFFREGFDGSGGEDWFSAGSCVDARLTSAWNWCQGLPNKDFYGVFKLAGFLGFDGVF